LVSKLIVESNSGAEPGGNGGVLPFYFHQNTMEVCEFY